MPHLRAISGRRGLCGGGVDDGDESRNELRLCRVVNRVRRAVELADRAADQPRLHVADAALALPLAHRARSVGHPQVHGKGQRRPGERIPGVGPVGGGEHPLPRLVANVRVVGEGASWAEGKGEGEDEGGGQGGGE